MEFRKISFVVLGILLALPSGLRSQNPNPQGAKSPPPLDLAELVQEATERNLEIQAARQAVEAKRARIPQARAWPDPMVTIGYGGNLLPPFTLMRGDPSSARQFAAEQEIPYPGKTRLRGRIASQEADSEQQAYEAVRRRVIAEIKQAYFDLYFTDRSLTTLGKDRELLEKFEKIAEIRYSVGKAAQQDVLKAQIELSRLTERETLLQQARRTLEAQLNTLRNFPVDASMGATGEVRPSALPDSFDDLEKAAEANYPDLKRARTLVESNRLGIDLARKEVRPDFRVGYTYMQRDAQVDMYGITLSTSLPIFRRAKQNMAIAEAAANLASARSMETNELVLLRNRVRKEFLEVQSAEQLMKLYAKAIVPQSALTLESSISTYETGTTDFLTVISNFEMALDYELSYQQQLANHEKAVARLEELTGLNLIE
jgi:outer membrane protein, heavy metal efflux system